MTCNQTRERSRESANCPMQNIQHNVWCTLQNVHCSGHLNLNNVCCTRGNCDIVSSVYTACWRETCINYRRRCSSCGFNQDSSSSLRWMICPSFMNNACCSSNVRFIIIYIIEITRWNSVFILYRLNPNKNTTSTSK